MAQLIKLYHYPSRYENDIYQYASRFIPQKRRRYHEYKQKFGSGKYPESLRTAFHDDFYKNQLIWATSTPTHRAEPDVKYRRHRWLSFFLQALQDTVFILCEPIFDSKLSGRTVDFLFMTPQSIWCVNILEGEAGSVFQGLGGGKWREVRSRSVDYLSDPLPPLERIVALVGDILRERQINMEIKGCLLVPESFTEYIAPTQKVTVCDRSSWRTWMNDTFDHHANLKYIQLRAAEALLDHCQTVGSERY
ncbi:hypothetical protein ACFO4N_06125 [Camelliibacillus cellulosilyticus]|uniref:Nuclease-like protein n=1 Tax=Camelliibacillus cellulosilyticus TaxID=2174486 RepID=A0ABV9GLY3_9BACL